MCGLLFGQGVFLVLHKDGRVTDVVQEAALPQLMEIYLHVTPN